MGADRDRSRSAPATVLYVALRAIDSLKTIFTPFLPFSSQAVHELLGNEGRSPGRSSFARSAATADPHEVLTGDYEIVDGELGAERARAGAGASEAAAAVQEARSDVVVPDELDRMRSARRSVE
mgnify:CR=1 FL=1